MICFVVRSSERVIFPFRGWRLFGNPLPTWLLPRAERVSSGTQRLVCGRPLVWMRIFFAIFPYSWMRERGFVWFDLFRSQSCFSIYQILFLFHLSNFLFLQFWLKLLEFNLFLPQFFFFSSQFPFDFFKIFGFTWTTCTGFFSEGFLDQRMFQDLISRWSLPLVLLNHLTNEIKELARKFVSSFNFTFFYHLAQLNFILCLEWRVSCCNLVHDTTKGPDVTPIIVLLSMHLFRAHVVGSSHVSLGENRSIVQLSREAEIS